MIAHLPKELFRKEAVLVTVLHKGMLRYKVRSVPGYGSQYLREKYRTSVEAVLFFSVNLMAG